MSSKTESDLSALWERHCELEFSVRDAAQTMTTMVPEPYVNHVPTMMGGVGQKNLQQFYATHFIPKLPKDTKQKLISRTIGENRIVDEFIFCFTHDCEIDWLLPGVSPTNKYVEVPMLAVVTFDGDKIANEHIYWDQATVLVQTGLLDPKNLPIAGIECARKLLDKTLPSNEMLNK